LAQNRKKWKPCQSGFSIGRLHFAGPSSGEWFYLRTLLTVVKGATSFEHLRSFEGVLQLTFKAACLAQGLLEDDMEWRLCLQEAAVMQTGSNLRRLFATLLLHCFPSDPAHLWGLFREQICDDLQYQLEHRHGIQDHVQDQVYDFGLFLINKILVQAGRSLDQFQDMPQIIGHWEDIVGNHFIAEQRNYNPDGQLEMASANIARLNPGQKLVHETILNSTLSREGGLFFVNGPGGTGKSFTWTHLLTLSGGEV